MSEELLDKVRDAVDGVIDFDGQRRAEVFATLLLALSGLLALNVGYTKQDIVLAVYVLLVGTALTFLVVVPPWPFFKRNPAKWLPVGSGLGASTG